MLAGACQGAASRVRCVPRRKTCFLLVDRSGRLATVLGRRRRVRQMCGIVGLFIKNATLEARLGELVAAMLVEMSERGPDSAGIAFYRNPIGADAVKLVLFSGEETFDWAHLAQQLEHELGDKVALEGRASHALLVVHEILPQIRHWLHEHHPDLRLMSAGTAIEIFKEKGLPRDVVRRFRLGEIA